MVGVRLVWSLEAPGLSQGRILEGGCHQIRPFNPSAFTRLAGAFYGSLKPQNGRGSPNLRYS